MMAQIWQFMVCAVQKMVQLKLLAHTQSQALEQRISYIALEPSRLALL